jgi:hypothetical protein
VTLGLDAFLHSAPRATGYNEGVKRGKHERKKERRKREECTSCKQMMNTERKKTFTQSSRTKRIVDNNLNKKNRKVIMQNQ